MPVNALVMRVGEIFGTAFTVTVAVLDVSTEVFPPTTDVTVT